MAEAVERVEWRMPETRGERKGAAEEAAGAPNCHVTSRLASGACRTARPNTMRGGGRGAGMVERVHRKPSIKACALRMTAPRHSQQTL